MTEAFAMQLFASVFQLGRNGYFRRQLTLQAVTYSAMIIERF